MASPSDANATLSYSVVSSDSPRASPQTHRTETDSNEDMPYLSEGTPWNSRRNVDPNHPDNLSNDVNESLTSHEENGRENQRLEDDLEILKVERVVSNGRKSMDSIQDSALHVPRGCKVEEPVDDFDIDTKPIHERTRKYQPPEYPSSSIAKIFKRIHRSSVIVRWIIYITPITIIFSIPILLSLFIFKDTKVGGIRLFWIGVWLEVIWLTLWLARLVAKTIPWPLGITSSFFTDNSKKWRDMGKALEVPATMLLWVIAIEISFLHFMRKYHLDSNHESRTWERSINKVILTAIVGATLNFVEKIIIHLIAMSFHLRTYADRIEINNFQISSLVKLYIFSKKKIAMKDSDFELSNTSGYRTPMAYVSLAGKNARQVLTKVSDVAGKVAEDFTGQAVQTSTHPRQVVLQLIHSSNGPKVLARRLYRTFAQDGSKTVLPDDLRSAFDNEEEAHAAFSMFDKDQNGDISMEELEAVCVEIGRERKGITASLKDLDSVVSKLDQVFLFIVFIITVLVFLSLISASASVIMTSAGSTILALSWLFQATAQEFLQSIIFVFVKHPFDVGDRVTIYGNTGKTLTGDDYFVKGISLLYTEFKKMEGHIVQAPNSYLNTIFVLNQRRSGGLAEAVPVTIKFGTTLEQIDNLRQRLLEFVASENREYQKNILTELTTIYEAYSITLNIVFFYKSNWQNELLRLQRRNKFICAMMVTMNDLGIEGPRKLLPGSAEKFPFYLRGAYPEVNNPTYTPTSHPENSTPEVRNLDPSRNEPDFHHQHSTKSTNESANPQYSDIISKSGKRPDLSLGMSSVVSSTTYADLIADSEPIRVPHTFNSSSTSTTNSDFISTSDRALVKRGTSRSSLGSTKRRAFMSIRGRNKITKNETSTLDDLENGQSITAMDDIIEVGTEAVRQSRNI